MGSSKTSTLPCFPIQLDFDELTLWRSKLKRRTLVLSTALFLSGCGWHLRGVQDIPLATIYLKLSENSGIGAAIRRNLLARTKTKVVETPEEAEAIFELLSIRRGSNVLAYNSEGKARIYELITKAVFRVTLPNGAEVVPETTLTTSRELNWDERDWNGKAQEERLLYKEMEESIISQIVNSLAHISSDQIKQAQHAL